MRMFESQYWIKLNYHSSLIKILIYIQKIFSKSNNTKKSKEIIQSGKANHFDYNTCTVILILHF
jgi:hypothetical protein